MRTWPRIAKRAAIVVYLIILHAALIYLAGEHLVRKLSSVTPVDSSSVATPGAEEAIPSPVAAPDAFIDQLDLDRDDGSPSPQPNREVGFVIPVIGVRPEQLLDTFSDSRSEGRFHDAIDIAAPAGTPVIAAADGEIVRFFDSERGGITIYQLTADRKFVLYYAHLQRRADEISVGMNVSQGATIGYVGDTGNAGAGNFHLHFAISYVTDPKRPWEGASLNPYPILLNGGYPQVP